MFRSTSFSATWSWWDILNFGIATIFFTGFSHCNWLWVFCWSCCSPNACLCSTLSLWVHSVSRMNMHPDKGEKAQLSNPLTHLSPLERFQTGHAFDVSQQGRFIVNGLDMVSMNTGRAIFDCCVQIDILRDPGPLGDFHSSKQGFSARNPRETSIS